MKKKSLTIVGAGVSGLYLAYLLQEDFEITILEARERVGGRIFSIDGHDMGPSWVWPHQTHLLSLTQKLGLTLFRQYTKGDALYDTQGRVERFNAPATAPSFRLHGSLTQLIEALHQNLKNVDIQYSEAVESIEVGSNSVEIQTAKRSYESDFVVLTLPPRLAANVDFTPKLPLRLEEQMRQTQTWMGNSAKCVIEFESAFWREQGLSGFAFSHLGPLGEIHDASTADKPALFGFVNLNADMQNFERDVRAQMKRLFAIEDEEILKIYLVDWKKEIFSAAVEDATARSGHPNYGIDTSSYSPRVYFSATEFSHEEGGYIEGALIQSERVSRELLCSEIFLT